MAKESKGFLKTWKDDRGFGFIKPDDGSDDIFIHISALGECVRRPHRGDVIFYQVEHSDDGKSKAVNATIEGVGSVAQKGSKQWILLALSSLGLAGVAVATYFLAAG